MIRVPRSDHSREYSNTSFQLESSRSHCLHLVQFVPLIFILALLRNASWLLFESVCFVQAFRRLSPLPCVP
ncbi:hypothetical protein BGZ60DRAFT_400895 [Tricladium varicosporioides]|nr:hypothetical protein BGZ60DRAFT_400895 [Hymenoscyphus varicosporioides]